jgi:hypothetical protein
MLSLTNRSQKMMMPKCGMARTQHRASCLRSTVWVQRYLKRT